MKQFFIVLLVLVVFLVVCVPQPIDLDNYPEQRDYGTLTPEEQKLFDEIIAAAESGQETVKGQDFPNVRKLSIHLGLYYGEPSRWPRLMMGINYDLELDLETFHEFEQARIAIDARVEEALLNMSEGSDRYKLWQISKYLADRITYTDGARDAIGGLDGKGVCATYAMLFYKMATRLGIECYYCVGYAGGGLHAWNMVVLDGEEYFYDVTWFDNVVHDYRYLHSPTAWGREYQLNEIEE